jgi:predicted Zn-dependent peptidase
MAGGARHEDLVEHVADAFSVLKGKSVETSIAPPVARAGVYPHARDLEQTHLCFGTPCVSQLDEEWFAAYLLHTALGGGMSSRLFQEIREQRGLAYDVTSFLSTYRDAGYLGVYVATSAESVAEVMAITCRTLRQLAKDGISAEELRRAKGHTKGGMLLSLETSEARMNRLARSEIYFRRYLPPQEVAAGIERVTLDDVHALAKRCFANEEWTLTMLGELPRMKNLRALLA